MESDAFPIEFKTGIHRLEHLGGHYLEIPASVVKRLGGKFNVRLLCTVNGALTFRCGIVALGEGAGYISLNAERMKKTGAKAGDEVRILLAADPSEYGMEVPPELEEVLRQDPEGERRFRQLVPGKRRFVIRFVSGVKSSGLRVEKAVLVIANLKRLPPGKESFKGLVEQPS